ncbi:MAG TPA: hypothetical protein VME69_01615 [Methylocella sp.]|nr:hypothetical protein [Methylocella sp.]
MPTLANGSVELWSKKAQEDGRLISLNSDDDLLCVEMFNYGVDKLGRIAEELDGLAKAMTSAVSEIEARGDRIDWLQAENRSLLDDLLNHS